MILIIHIVLGGKIMTSLVSSLIYLLLFILCFIGEIKKNKKWDNIFYPKSRFDSKGITTIYCISFVYMTFFMIINLIIGESIELCIGITLSALVMLLIASFSSNICVVITDNEIIKKSFLGKKIIKIREIRSIEEGYFIKIKSKKDSIQLETKFYDVGIRKVKNRLSEINKNK